MQRHASQRSIVILLSYGLCSFVAGCTSDKDVSTNPQYLGFAHLGQLFVLQHDVYVLDENSNLHFPWDDDLWATLPEKETGLYGSPLPAISEWQRSHQPSEIRGVIRSGAVFSLEKLVYHWYFEGDTSYYRFKVVDGDFRGQTICLNELMSPRSRDRSNYAANNLYKDPNPENMRAVP
jgi:hypothetical protein